MHQISFPVSGFRWPTVEFISNIRTYKHPSIHIYSGLEVNAWGGRNKMVRLLGGSEHLQNQAFPGCT